MIEPIRDHWVIALGVAILVAAVIAWWQSRR
jgi:hypothetical protein